jgi:hypothetical protein
MFAFPEDIAVPSSHNLEVLTGKFNNKIYLSQLRNRVSEKVPQSSICYSPIYKEDIPVLESTSVFNHEQWGKLKVGEYHPLIVEEEAPNCWFDVEYLCSDDVNLHYWVHLSRIGTLLLSQLLHITWRDNLKRGTTKEMNLEYFITGLYNCCLYSKLHMTSFIPYTFEDVTWVWDVRFIDKNYQLEIIGYLLMLAKDLKLLVYTYPTEQPGLLRILK